jgi:hypothetical protein
MTAKGMNLKRSELASLHRYFITADRMKVHFYEIVTKKSADLGFGTAAYIESQIYMSMWYGTLFVVLEGYLKLGINDSKVEILLSESEKIKALKLYRNATFHFQKEYLSQKCDKILADKNSAVWVHAIHDAFSVFFFEYLEFSKQKKISTVD